MKNIIFIVAIAAASFAACNSGNNTSATSDATQATPQIDSTLSKVATTTSGSDAKVLGSIKEIVSGYLQIKNGLANDDGQAAASGGKVVVDVIGKFDKSLLTAEQKKVYEGVADDIKENSEHIGENGNKIAHQREHFEMLSKDIYDLVKKFGAGQMVYHDFCPMYNNKKGATWISETKEIKNPYLGREMPTCGIVKEEIK